MSQTPTIVYTLTDEAPALATHSLLPIIEAFAAPAGIGIELKDISLAGRILAVFPERLTDAQRAPDALAELGAACLTPDANIIKLPNISASVPQLKEAIKELQEKGYDVPSYPEVAKTDEDKEVQTRYAKVLGSAVNPVLREGNSDRRAPLAVKNFSKKHPHKLAAWPPESKAEVVHMSDGDFYGNEQSVVMGDGGDISIELVAGDGAKTVLKDKLTTSKGEIVDGTFMSVKALRTFYEEQIEDAKANGQLLSLHLKATMMKVSDPIIFGHMVRVFYADVFEKHAATFAELGVNPNNGIGDVYAKIKALPADKQAALDSGCDAYLSKPLDESKLFALLEEFLGDPGEDDRS